MSDATLYQERFTRIKKAMHYEPVDQIPVIWSGPALAPRLIGMKMAQYVSDLEASSFAGLQAMEKIGGFDGTQTPSGGGVLMLSGLWLSKVKQPGKELPDDSLWQIDEAEVMTQADYDTIINKGWNPFLMEYLPKVADMPEFMRQAGWAAENGRRVAQTYKDAGYVVINDAGVMVSIPFESLCGGRSMNKFYMDLHRIPDKVEAAMRVVQEQNLATINALPPCSPDQVGSTWLGGWRSASGLLAPKLWDRFVWPYMRELAEAYISKGYTPIFHWDQDWTRDLGHLTELPARSCVLSTDGMTDVRKFRKIVGDNMAFLGDVPAALFSSGTPEDMREYVRCLVNDIGSAGLLLTSGCDMPINSKLENLEAFVAAAHEFGTVTA